MLTRVTLQVHLVEQKSLTPLEHTSSHCLPVFDLRLLIAPSVSSHFVYLFQHTYDSTWFMNSLRHCINFFRVSFGRSTRIPTWWYYSVKQWDTTAQTQRLNKRKEQKIEKTGTSTKPKPKHIYKQTQIVVLC